MYEGPAVTGQPLHDEALAAKQAHAEPFLEGDADTYSLGRAEERVLLYDQLTADGQPPGVGRLEGVILQDFKLSDPFPLGAFGSFTPPSEGRLYLRCGDAWNELAENRGAVTVKRVPGPRDASTLAEICPARM